MTVLPFPIPAPLYEGGAAGVGDGVAVSGLAGHNYLIDLAQYDRRTLPALKNAQDVSGSPGEAALSTEGAWLKFQQDWHLGAGRDRFDDDDQDLDVRRRRFASSKGIDPWTAGQLRLQKRTELCEPFTNSAAVAFSIGARLYMANGAALAWATNPLGSWTTVTGTPGGSDLIRCIASDGVQLFLGTDVGVYTSGVTTSTATHLGVATPVVRGIAFANGRLVIGTTDGKVQEVASDGTLIDIYEHYSTTFDFTVIAAGPNKIYAGGAQNGVSTLRRIGVDDTGALVDEGSALNLPAGESLRAMTFIMDVCVLATSKGLRYATVATDGTLNVGPNIEEPGDVRALCADSPFVWGSWTDYDTDSTGLVRIDLEHFANQLTPAFASDLMVTGEGLVTSIVRFAGRTYFVVAGLGLYGEHASEHVSAGSIDMGWIDYGLPYDKVWTAFDLRHDPLSGTITAVATNDRGGLIATMDSIVAGSVRPPSRFTMNNARGEKIRLVITLAHPTGGSPTLRRWLMQAFVAPDRTDEIQFPIVLHTQVRDGAGEGQPVAYDTLAEWLYLHGLCGSGQIVTLRQGDLVEQVKIDDLDFKPKLWTDDGRYYQGILLAVLHTV